jgi:hypothetical protein
MLQRLAPSLFPPPLRTNVVSLSLLLSLIPRYLDPSFRPMHPPISQRTLASPLKTSRSKTSLSVPPRAPPPLFPSVDPPCFDLVRLTNLPFQNSGFWLSVKAPIFAFTVSPSGLEKAEGRPSKTFAGSKTSREDQIGSWETQGRTMSYASSVSDKLRILVLGDCGEMISPLCHPIEHPYCTATCPLAAVQGAAPTRAHTPRSGTAGDVSRRPSLKRCNRTRGEEFPAREFWGREGRLGMPSGHRHVGERDGWMDGGREGGRG